MKDVVIHFYVHGEYPTQGEVVLRLNVTKEDDLYTIGETIFDGLFHNREKVSYGYAEIREES